MMRWEAEQKGYTCNDCFLAMANCKDMSICCEDETGLCDWFEEIEEEGETDVKRMAEYIVKESGYPGRLETENVGELIRCKDCRHWREQGLCGIWDQYISNGDFYCGCAEQKEGEAE